MFNDPRCGTDRRARYPCAIARQDEKRRGADRRARHESRTGERWWLMRSYVIAEKFIGAILR